MSVLGRLLLGSAQRLDLPDLKAIDSYVMGDFKYLMESLVGANTPYILKGFDVINPRLAVGTNSITINVVDSIVFCPNSVAGPFFVGLEAGNPLSTPLVPQLQFPTGIGSLVNYVYITLTTVDGVSDTRAFWDKNLNAQAGGEFAQIVKTETYLIVEPGVSTSGFPTGSIPICQVQVSSTTIDWIKDCRYMMFRLGSGGLNPDIYSQYNFRSLPTIGNERTEQPITVNGGSSVTDNPFQGADKNIYSLKEWMDVVMTKLKELGGTSFWYQYAGGSIINLFNDTMGSIYQSKGSWSHSVSLPGRISWSEDIKITSIIDPRVYVVERYLSLDLDNEQIAYLNLIRDSIINVNNFDLEWTNAQKYVNGQVGSFLGLEHGDWIKPAGSPNNHYVRIEEFYTQVNLGGIVCIPSIAKSVKISNSYEIMTVPVLGGAYINGFIGATQVTPGQYSKGSYAAADIEVIQRNDLPSGVSTALGLGDGFSWLAYRSDTIENISDITTRTLTCSITPINPTSSRVTVTASVPIVDTLISGMVITIDAGSSHAGTYTIEVEDAAHFIINSTGISEVGTNAYYAMVTTAQRTNPDGTIIEESANHRFEDYGLVIIDNTINYNGTYRIKDYSTTSFTIPVSSALANDTSGYAIQANVNVRMESGIERLVQGESKEIGESEAENIMEYIGQPDNEVIVPVYLTPYPNDYLDGQSNYENLTKDDDLTKRIARLTSMMADKAQDKTIQIIAENITNVINTSGVISFISPVGLSPILNAIIPSSLYNSTIDISGGITLAANQVSYITIDRNLTAGSLLVPIVCAIEALPLEENIFVIAMRLLGTSIWLWNGQIVEGSGQSVIFMGQDALINDTRFKPVANSTPNKTIKIYPSKRAILGKTLYSYVKGNISSKFPRTAYISGDYDGGTHHNQLTTISFADIGTVTATGPTFGAQVLGSMLMVASRFKPVSIFINADDSISYSEGASYALLADALKDDNIPLGISNQFKVATVIIATDAGGVIQPITEAYIIDRRAFGGGGGGGGTLNVKSVNGAGYVITDFDGFDYFDVAATANVTLPAPGNNIGRTIYIKNVGPGAITTILRNNVLDTIDGIAANYILGLQYQCIALTFMSANTVRIIGGHLLEAVYSA